jgi:hypothetical protein
MFPFQTNVKATHVKMALHVWISQKGSPVSVQWDSKEIHANRKLTNVKIILA